ncbi:NUDIX hydrolase [Flavobacteriales bacterium]|nr:NUDIX hydrolase [Flavobacteriales bacterium]
MNDPDKNPWTKISTKEVYENPWIKVEHHTVLTPSKGAGIYGTVAFKNLAIGIIPLDTSLNTWIVGQYRFPLNTYSWEIPEGGGPIGEETIDTAKRELSEEVGLKANKWTMIQTFHLSNSVSDEYGELFLAQELKEFENHPDPEEELIVKKLPFEEVFQMVLKGEITDSMSVMGILKVKYLIANQLI